MTFNAASANQGSRPQLESSQMIPVPRGWVEPRVDVCGHLRMVAEDDTLVAVWGGPPDAEQMLELEATILEQRDKCGHTLFLLNLVEPGSPSLNAIEREALASFYRRMAPHLAGACIVIEGDDFWAVGARAVTKAMVALQSLGYPRRVFGDHEQAMDWLSDSGALKGRETAATLRRCYARNLHAARTAEHPRASHRSLLPSFVPPR